MPYHAQLYPLGYPVEIVSNSERALAEARESWASWPVLFDKPPLRFKIQIHNGRAPRRIPRF
ncbi:MAG TPA: hypothetical protein VFW83_05765, partial [Bryobacteraceae bacterium]|nr:hypothetical protein [Bryobacteraceae bacterium]